MKLQIHKVGAVFFILWGLFHVIVGGLALATILAGGGAAFLALLGTDSPALLQVLDAVLAQHTWNLMWIGALVLVVGVRLNWRNSRQGFYLNLTVASAAELGSVFALIIPGLIPLTENLLGPIIWALAVIFGTLGFLRDETTP